MTLQLHVANSAGCCGLADLLAAQRLARRSGGDVLLAAPTARVRQLLSLSRMDEEFGIQASVHGGALQNRRVIASRAAGASAHHLPACGDG
jgi:anti-anti-sigma regulatory factor